MRIKPFISSVGITCFKAALLDRYGAIDPYLSAFTTFSAYIVEERKGWRGFRRRKLESDTISKTEDPNDHN